MSVYCLGILAEKEYGVAVEAEGIPACYFQQCGGRQ